MLTLPEDFSVEATGPEGAIVTYTATAPDEVDGEVPVSCNRLSGSTFVLGETEVTCTATDKSGNKAPPDNFLVTVQDTTPPVLTLPEDFSVEATNDPDGVRLPVVTYPASADDAVDGQVDVNCTSPSDTPFELGPTNVNCSATDSAGNSATGDFDVTVVVAVPYYFDADRDGIGAGTPEEYVPGAEPPGWVTRGGDSCPVDSGPAERGGCPIAAPDLPRTDPPRTDPPIIVN